MLRAALEVIDSLGLELGPTKDGAKLKGWAPDREDGGVVDFYLGAEDCAALSRAFRDVAEGLRHGGEDVASMLDPDLGDWWILDEAGKQARVDVFTYRRWMAEHWRVGQDQVGEYWVSTVCLGVDHLRCLGTPPLAWETRVTRGTGPCDEFVDGDRYERLDAAEQGHERMVAAYRSKAGARA